MFRNVISATHTISFKVASSRSASSVCLWQLALLQPSCSYIYSVFQKSTTDDSKKKVLLLHCLQYFY